jgi:hypothetical protein
VLVLRLRPAPSLRATFVKAVGDYADRLVGIEGRLYLSGLQSNLAERLGSTGTIDGPVCAFEAAQVVAESTQAAYLNAEAWPVQTARSVTVGREPPARVSATGQSPRRPGGGARVPATGAWRMSLRVDTSTSLLGYRGSLSGRAVYRSGRPAVLRSRRERSC